MNAIDYTKPITFRPSDRDRAVLELLAEHNPVLCANSADLLRVALQHYMQSKDRLDTILAEHQLRLADLAARLDLVYIAVGLNPTDNKALSAQEERG